MATDHPNIIQIQAFVDASGRNRTMGLSENSEIFVWEEGTGIWLLKK